jgi:hypothetical protein
MLQKNVETFLFLNELKLSEKKTLITDITKSPAKFLGFEIRSNARGWLG